MPAKKKHKVFRVIAWVLLGFFLLFSGVVLWVRSPWGQDLIVGKALDYVSSKTETKVSIDRLFITFSGNAYVDGLYAEDQAGDTLIYSHNLEISVAFLPLIFDNTLNLDFVAWSGLKANISRNELTGLFNFDFLIDAFSSPADSTLEEDTAQSTPMKFDIGTIRLDDFDLRYNDQVLGINSTLQLGTLFLDVDQINLDSMSFELDELKITNTRLSYVQTKSTPTPEVEDEDKTSSNSILPYFSVEKLILDQVNLLYNQPEDSLLAQATIGHLQLTDPLLNLADQRVTLEKLVLEHTDITYNTRAPHASTSTDTTAQETTTSFQWPNWQVAVAEISLSDNQLSYKAGSEQSKLGIFNPNAISISDFQFHAKNIDLQEGQIHIDLQQVAFKESSGLNLKQLGFQLAIDNQHATISGFDLTTDQNTLKADIALQYPSIDQLINDPLLAEAHLSITEMRLRLSEIYLFLPDLTSDSTISAIASRDVTGVLDVKASKEHWVINHSNVSWGETTSIVLNGLVDYPLDSVRLKFDLDQMDVHTRREDVETILGQQNLGIRLPDVIEMKSKIAGGLENIRLNGLIESTDGQIVLKGKLSKKDMMAIDATLEVKDLNLEHILQNEKLGLMSFKAETKGHGNDLASLNAQLITHFTALELNKRDYSNFILSAEMKNSTGHVNLSIDDKFIQMSLDGNLSLDDKQKEMDFVLDLKGMDLYELGFTAHQIRTKVHLKAHVLMQDSTGIKWNASLKEGVTIYEGESYAFGAFEINGEMSDDSTSVYVNSKILQAKLAANADPSRLIAALQRHVYSYLQDTLVIDSVDRPVMMNLDFGIQQTSLLREVLLPDLERMDAIVGHMAFDEAKHQLEAKLSIPFTKYQGITIDDLLLIVDSDSKQMNFSLGWQEVSMDPILIQRTSIDGVIKKKQLTLDFSSYDKGKLLVHAKSTLRAQGDSILYHLVPDSLVINRLPWSIPSSNQVSIAQKYIHFTDFKLTRNHQSLALTTELPKMEQEHVGLVLENFNIATLTSFLTGGDSLLAGRMGGNFILINPYGQLGLVANLQIDQLVAMDAPLGTLKLKGSSKSATKYDFDLAINGDNLDMELTGEYNAVETGSELNLDLDLQKFNAKTAAQLSEENLADATGIITGKAKVRGTLAKPQYNGNFRFEDVAFLVSAIDARFILADENIQFNQEEIKLNNFTVRDEKDNSFKIDGSVLTKDFTNPAFDLTLTAKNFLALNSKKGDNDLFYGKVNMDANLTIKGDLKIPIVRGKVKVNEGTSFTVIVPESELDLKERDGVVVFVNKDHPDDILTRSNVEVPSANALTGYNINTVISINEKSNFKIIVNEKTNDYLEIAGKGDFNFGLESNGRMSFTGRYEIGSGHYKASLFNLVTKEFDIAAGGRIVWKGDPLDADLDVKAIYKITTSAAPLMSLKTSGQGTEVANLYNRRLPFLVYLNVKEELLKPAISFELDMPKDDQGTFGGEVYAQIKQLNEKEEELNKQVFSLLVLDRFFPASGSDGSSGGSAAIARENVSQVLSSQLNSVSDKIVGDTGFELNFNVDSYTDYQGETAENRTQLDINAKRKLLDDRLIMQVGSDVNIQGSKSNQQNTPLIGNASVEYLLTENGRYRIKGFSKEEFDTVIDGQYMVTGIAFSFNREFNKFKELWMKSANEEKIKTDDVKMRKDNKQNAEQSEKEK